MITFSIADIHGCLPALRELVDKCLSYAASRGENYRFVFLGDYLDRGPFSAQVVAYLRSWQAADSNIILLKGNHEEMFIDAAASGWMEQENADFNEIEEIFGRPETKKSFLESAINPRETAAFLHGLPTFFDDGLRYYVHAGIRPGVDLWDQTDLDRLWIRNDFLYSVDMHPRYVVHGHTPVRPLGLPQKLHNRLNLDTGACWPEEGGKLTAAIFTNDQLQPIAFAQTAATPWRMAV